MDVINSIPPEVLLQILTSCSNFPQMISLVSTCRNLYSLFVAHSGFLLWEIGQQTILNFDDALTAVRHLASTSTQKC